MPTNLAKTKYQLLLITIILVVFGLFMVYNASVIDAFRDFGDKFYYFKLQSKWALLSVLLMLLVSRINPQKLFFIAAPLWFISILLLILVLIPGIGNKYLGARRWIGIGSIRFQPSEVAKLSITIYLSAILSKRSQLEKLIPHLLLATGLIMMQPDLGTTIVIVLTCLITYYLSGGEFKRMILISAVIFLIGIVLILSSPYRKSRLLTFLDPGRDPQGGSYHIRQALIAFGNGGFFGVGLGQSRQKYQYLPEVTTDSIFAIVGEELGFVGSASVILAIFWLILLCLKISQNAPTSFQKLLSYGMTSWIAIQSLINLGAILGAVPLTGIPLPLISYGGSSLAVTLISIGIILSTGKHEQNRR